MMFFFISSLLFCYSLSFPTNFAARAFLQAYRTWDTLFHAHLGLFRVFLLFFLFTGLASLSCNVRLHSLSTCSWGNANFELPDNFQNSLFSLLSCCHYFLF
jgi:hypothetical protein